MIAKADPPPFAEGGGKAFAFPPSSFPLPGFLPGTLPQDAQFHLCIVCPKKANDHEVVLLLKLSSSLHSRCGYYEKEDGAPEGTGADQVDSGGEKKVLRSTHFTSSEAIEGLASHEFDSSGLGQIRVEVSHHHASRGYALEVNPAVFLGKGGCHEKS